MVYAHHKPPSSSRKPPPAPGQSRGLRSRLFCSFLVPVFVFGLGAFILFEVILYREAQGAPLSPLRIYLVLTGLLLLAVFLVALFALYTGDNIIRPVAWLLRTIDDGPPPSASKTSPPPADREIDAVCGRVQVLLRQNLSGAKAMRKLDALQNEIGAVLDAVDSNTLIPDKWPRDGSTQELTRRLLGSMLTKSAHQQESTAGVMQLQGLLEQDWREETLVVKEIARRTEQCFMLQTQILIELDNLEKIVSDLSETGNSEIPTWREAADLVNDLQLGFGKWHEEVNSHLQETSIKRSGRNWEAWIQESIGILSSLVLSAEPDDEAPHSRIAGKLDEVTGMISNWGREGGSLSQEAKQLLRAWNRLSERMRTLLVRVEEIQEDAPVAGALEREDTWSG